MKSFNCAKKVSWVSFKNVTYKMFRNPVWYRYKKDLALNNLQWLICHKANQLQQLQKQQRIDDSEHCLQQFQCNKKEISREYMTMDQASIHHFTLELNRQSTKEIAAGENRPKRRKTQTWTGKVLTSVFWDARGILFINYLEKGRTIISKQYIALLVHLKEETAKNKMATNEEEKVLFHQDNTLFHKSQRWQNYLNWTSNCFCTNLIHQIWPLATTGCLQTSKECSSERDSAPMTKWYRKPKCSLRPKTNRSTKKASNC